MFEDSLVESTTRIRTRAQHYVVGSFFVEAALLSVLVLLPCLYPEALPRKFLTLPLLAPPPPATPAPPAPRPARPTKQTAFLDAALIAPSRIPTGVRAPIDTLPPEANIPGLSNFGNPRNGVLGLPDLGITTPPPALPPHPARSTDRIRVSAGVAAGQLIVPIRPVYPVIAMEARVQGTVVVDAVIAKDGRIASLHILSGPSLLVRAAIDAIQHARYKPWTLNGEPVEVETTIRIVFTLGDTHAVSQNASPTDPPALSHAL